MSIGSEGNDTWARLPEGQVSVSFKHLLDRAEGIANNVHRVNE